MITIDCREKPSGIIELFEKNETEFKVEKLRYADYIINDLIAIERKTAQDFIISIMDGRLFRQVINLIKNYDYTCLIIEGNPFNTKYNIKREAIEGALIETEIFLRTPVMFTKSFKDTYRRLVEIHEHTIKIIKGVVKRPGYKPKRMMNKQLFILQGLPHIGKVLSKRLLKHFGSLVNVFNASEEKLTKVKGINTKIAREIIETIQRKFDG
ncbi:hypothetical protein JXI42_07970 [bacterium]|nr:hypothetical protein [bacterium]